jgi:hypothetical protein
MKWWEDIEAMEKILCLEAGITPNGRGTGSSRVQKPESKFRATIVGWDDAGRDLRFAIQNRCLICTFYSWKMLI